MTAVKVRKNYQDITKEWLKTATPNSHRVKDRGYFEDENGRRYYVDGKNVILDYDEKEREVAYWLEKTFGGEIYILPRVNNPEGIKTPDYLFRDLSLDLKEIKGTGKRTIDSSIKMKKEQSPNFIFDLTNSRLEDNQILKQVQRLYTTAGREWVDIIIVKKHDKLLAVYKKRS